MSILASTSPASKPISADSEQARCSGCGSAILVNGMNVAPCCTACRRSQAEHEARRLLADVRELANGTGVFAEVPESERREQIRALILSTDDGKPSGTTPERALTDLVNVLCDSSVDLLADLISRRIAERQRKPGSRVPTLVRVAVSNLTDRALIDMVGETEVPILLNAASAELASRLCEPTTAKPLFAQEANAVPDAFTRDELEGHIEGIGGPEEWLEESPAKAAWNVGGGDGDQGAAPPRVLSKSQDRGPLGRPALRAISSARF